MNPILLDDYMGSPDFPGNLLALLGPLKEQIGLPDAPDEIGVVSPDVIAATEELAKRYGAGPFLIGAGSPKEFVEDGITKPYTTRVAFGYYRGVLIEIAEPGIGSDIFGRSLDPSGKITLDHLGFYARGDNLARKDRNGVSGYFMDRMMGAGYAPAFAALVDALGVVGNVTIFDTSSATSGINTEFLDIRLFGRRGIKIELPEWLLSLGGRLQIATGHRVFEAPADHPQRPRPRPTGSFSDAPARR